MPNSAFDLKLVPINKTHCVISMSNSTGNRVWHTIDRMPAKRAYETMRLMIHGMADGRKMNQENWIERQVYTTSRGLKYDKGYAVCCMCDLSLDGYDERYDLGAKNPNTGSSCEVNEYGGFVCSSACNILATREIEEGTWQKKKHLSS